MYLSNEKESVYMKNFVVKLVLGIAFIFVFNLCLHAYGHDSMLVSLIVGALIGTIIGLSED